MTPRTVALASAVVAAGLVLARPGIRATRRRSHRAMAMLGASPGTVLGDLAGHYHVRSDDVAGPPADFEVLHTIGRSPLLHWTRPALNRSTMYSQCQSTGVHKGYDPDTGDDATAWKEIPVGCGTCHADGHSGERRYAHGAAHHEMASGKNREASLARRGALR